MRLVFMSYYAGMHDEVMEILDRTGIRNYVHWREVEGRLSCGDPRDGTQTWPGYNSALQAVLREQTAEKLTDEIKAFNRAQRGEERIDAHFVELVSTIRAASEHGDEE